MPNTPPSLAASPLSPAAGTPTPPTMSAQGAEPHASQAPTAWSSSTATPPPDLAVPPVPPAPPVSAPPLAKPPPAARPPLAVLLRRVIGLAAVSGFVEVIGYLDVGGIYPAIMTGNTVQLGLTLATAQWARFTLIGFAIALFFLGNMIAAALRRRLRRPAVELAVMAVVLVIAGFVRLHAPARIPLELPLLALALAMQGETLSSFGGISIQTIVVTNNMVKFADAFIGRYFRSRAEEHAGASRPSFDEVMLFGCAWLFYSIAAALGALVVKHFSLPFLAPAVVLVLLAYDVLHERRPAAGGPQHAASTTPSTPS